MGCSKQGLLRRERFENVEIISTVRLKTSWRGGGIYFFVPPFFCVWPIFMPYFFVWQIKIFSTVAWQNVRAANRTKNFEKGQQKRKSLRKKKNFGDLWKNIFRIVTQPREQSQTSTSRTNAWQEAFGKCSMPNRNPSRTHSPKARGRS